MRLLTDKELLKKAREACKRANKTLYFLTYTFPKSKRNAALFLYYYMRTLDDIVDKKGITKSHRINVLREHRKRMEMLYSGKTPPNITNRDRALQNFISHNPATARAIKPHMENMLTTMEIDSNNKSKLIPYKELIHYCYLGGGSPFAITLSLLDPRAGEDTKENIARTLGVGMNLTHILRDFKKDVKLEDIKVTPDEKHRFNLFGPKMDNDGLRAFARERVKEASGFLNDGKKHIMKLNGFKLKLSFSIFRWRYMSMLKKVQLRNYDLMSDYKKTKPLEYFVSSAMLLKEIFVLTANSAFEAVKKPVQWVLSR
ncbi:MAG: squalene/phytoene synthase family protein [Candidatus Aenigmarchaeota archaeon]|nr:squalene/phytoene synthase family protein [Candidatus Aenigmarchaeota archaeon]